MIRWRLQGIHIPSCDIFVEIKRFTPTTMMDQPFHGVSFGRMVVEQQIVKSRTGPEGPLCGWRVAL